MRRTRVRLGRSRNNPVSRRKEAGADDRTRYRIACATLDHGARKVGKPLARVDAQDLLAWWSCAHLGSYCVPADVPAQAVRAAEALAGAGPLAESVERALRAAAAVGAGVVITMEPTTPALVHTVARSAARPDRPAAVRRIGPIRTSPRRWPRLPVVLRTSGSPDIDVGQVRCGMAVSSTGCR